MEPNNPERILTGVQNLDALLYGGLPQGSITVIAGSPGAGKTTLANQICFHNASESHKAIVFQTLSEPTLKTLKYISRFSFFEKSKFNSAIEFIDLGGILRGKGLETAITEMMDQIKRIKPSLVVIDSFKVFEDLAADREELRKFTYEIAVQLMSWEITGFLLGEYSMDSILQSPLFSVVDGIIAMNSKDESGEAQRFIRVLKMRGTDHDRNSHPYVIADDGIRIYNSRTSVSEKLEIEPQLQAVQRIRSGIKGLDEKIDGGFQSPSTILLTGVSGAGKTLFMLESICRGAAERSEKGLIVSFEMTPAELLTSAAALRLDLAGLIKDGMVEIIFIPQAQIILEKNIQTIQARVSELGPKRIGIDSLNVFVEKLEKPHLIREKILQLSTIIKSADAVGFLIMDLPFDDKTSRLAGSSESVPDAIIRLTPASEENSGHRSIQLLKMRNTNHAKRKYPFAIEPDGLKVLESAQRPIDD